MNKLIAKETGLFGVVHRKKEASMARTPLYAKIRNDLRTKIEQGEYAVGEVIPSEVELAETYGVSRPTVRQPCKLLPTRGIWINAASAELKCDSEKSSKVYAYNPQL